MIKYPRLCLVFIIPGFFVPLKAQSQSFIYQGINQIADAGAGQINSVDASATSTNPANLASIVKTSSYADVSAMAVRYTYAHTNFDPVTLTTNAPPVNLGASFFTNQGLNFGLLVSPRSAPGAKPIDVNDVPTYTGAGYALFDLKVKQTGMLAAFGAGYRVSDSGFSLGASVLYGKDGQEITAYANEGDHSTPGMDAKYEGASYQGLAGVRYEKSNHLLAASFRSPSVRRYKGDIASTVSDNVYVEYKGVSYQPATLAVAYESTLGAMSSMLELTREFWSRGRAIANRGLPYGSPETDFIDTFGLVMATRYRHSDTQALSVSCGYYSANTGDGSKSSSAATNLSESEIPASTGMEFGQMEAIPRYVIGGGYKKRFLNNSGYWMISGNYQTGTRIIPEGHKGEGWYHLDVYTVSGGLASSF